MSKFSILKGIDIGVLDSMILEYMRQTGNRCPYIFMSEETISHLPEANTTSQNTMARLKSSGMIGYYTGYKTFVDNTLEFGMVEIR